LYGSEIINIKNRPVSWGNYAVYMSPPFTQLERERQAIKDGEAVGLITF
jgi:hypothetical protein